MAPLKSLSFICLVATFCVMMIITEAQLSADYYDKTCSGALSVIEKEVIKALFKEPRMGASLLRMHFHDCFVNGCDASVLLNDNKTFTGEKTALPNLNSLRGFDVIDDIKAAVDKECGKPVVSCADILAVAARDSVKLLLGPNYTVLLGRKDSLTANKTAANFDLPAPFFNRSELISSFEAQGMNETDLVVLSGGHTIGLARCVNYRDRIYNDTNIDENYAKDLQETCPQGGDGNVTAPLDTTTPIIFDTFYFSDLENQKGLLHSDQELYKGDGSYIDQLVTEYAGNAVAFWNDFGNSMIKMGNLKPLLGDNGEVRNNCGKTN